MTGQQLSLSGEPIPPRRDEYMPKVYRAVRGWLAENHNWQPGAYLSKGDRDRIMECARADYGSVAFVAEGIKYGVWVGAVAYLLDGNR